MSEVKGIWIERVSLLLHSIRPPPSSLRRPRIKRSCSSRECERVDGEAACDTSLLGAAHNAPAFKAFQLKGENVCDGGDGRLIPGRHTTRRRRRDAVTVQIRNQLKLPTAWLRSR